MIVALIQINPHSAQSAVTEAGGKLVASNLYDGFDIYCTKKRTLLQTISVYSVENVPLPVTLVYGNRAILIGSSHGAVKILDLNSGKTLHDLRHNSLYDLFIDLNIYSLFEYRLGHYPGHCISVQSC